MSDNDKLPPVARETLTPETLAASLRAIVSEAKRPTPEMVEHALHAVESGWSSRLDFVVLAAEVRVLRKQLEQLERQHAELCESYAAVVRIARGGP